MLDICTYLNQIRFFDGLSQSSKEELSQICSLRELGKKDFLFHEGEQGFAVYVLLNGNVQLHKTSPEGKEIVIKIIQPGEIFAEVILFEKDLYPVTATAISESTVLLIPKSGIAQLLERKEFRNDFIAALMRKQRYLSTRIHYLSAHDLEDRLRMFLREHFGPNEHINCDLSKKDVAAAISATPESLSRLLLRLSKEGVMKWKGHGIQVNTDFWGEE